jgi:acyl-CoA reductase-like NAD-dependent aldehyde dehydrogenase
MSHDLSRETAALRQAHVAWAARTLDDRAAVLRTIGKRFAARAEDIAATVGAETKKDGADAWFTDVVPNLDLFEWWAGAGRKAIEPRAAAISRIKFPGKSGRIVLEPKGIIGLITPWNYPSALILRSLVPALLAGNCVLLKPSEHTPRTGQLIADIFNEVLPPNVLVVAQGAGDVGAAVVDAADHVVFIGSLATGRKVAVQAAQQLKTVSLELGGKDAAIVFADCDLERTAAGVLWGAFANSGQNCAAIERCYVEAPLYEAFVRRLVDLAGTLKVAPLVTEAQAEIVRRHLDDAVARGATAHGSLPGAVILTNVPHDALVATEETFGPLLPVWPVDNAEEAIQQANRSAYGLTCSLWTSNVRRGEAMAASVSAGVVSVNNTACTAAMPFAPWSGRRGSGHGVTNSEFAILEMVQPKFVLVDSNKDPEVWWYPYTDDAVALARQTIGWLTAAGVDKIAKTVGILGAMKKRIAGQKDWARRS